MTTLDNLRWQNRADNYRRLRLVNVPPVTPENLMPRHHETGVFQAFASEPFCQHDDPTAYEPEHDNQEADNGAA